MGTRFSNNFLLHTFPSTFVHLEGLESSRESSEETWILALDGTRPVTGNGVDSFSCSSVSTLVLMFPHIWTLLGVLAKASTPMWLSLRPLKQQKDLIKNQQKSAKVLKKSQIGKIKLGFFLIFFRIFGEIGEKSGTEKIFWALKRLARLFLQCSHIEEDRAHAAFKCVARKKSMRKSTYRNFFYEVHISCLVKV